MSRYSSKIILLCAALMLVHASLTQECLTGSDFSFIKLSKTNAKNYVMRNTSAVTSQELAGQIGVFQKYIAEGSFGKVNLYKKGGSKFAVKNLKRDPNIRDYDYQLLFLEMNANSCMIEYIGENEVLLKHFALIKGVFFNTTTKEFVFVMDFVQTDLEKYVKSNLKKSYDNYDSEKQRVILKLLLVLGKQIQFMHDNKLVHRDLKLENVMMSGDLPVTGDFGMTSPEYKNYYDQVGTPYFMDPYLVSKGQGSYKSDVYSVGVMFYLILNGFNSYKILDNMVVKGGFMGNKAMYRPNTKLLVFPRTFKSLESMVSTMPASRPDMSEVVQFLQNLYDQGNQLPKIQMNSPHKSPYQKPMQDEVIQNKQRYQSPMRNDLLPAQIEYMERVKQKKIDQENAKYQNRSPSPMIQKQKYQNNSPSPNIQGMKYEYPKEIYNPVPNMQKVKYEYPKKIENGFVALANQKHQEMFGGQGYQEKENVYKAYVRPEQPRVYKEQNKYEQLELPGFGQQQDDEVFQPTEGLNKPVNAFRQAQIEATQNKNKNLQNNIFFI